MNIFAISVLLSTKIISFFMLFTLFAHLLSGAVIHTLSRNMGLIGHVTRVMSNEIG